jgi:uncharacterized protein YciI
VNGSPAEIAATRRRQVDFDDYTITLLMQGSDGPRLGEAEAAAMQDKHMAHIADLADLGHLVAAGPLFDETYRGLSILTVPPEEAVALKSSDPAVRAGLYTVKALSWRLPAGAMSFTPARFPRSLAEALG